MTRGPLSANDGRILTICRSRSRSCGHKSCDKVSLDIVESISPIISGAMENIFQKFTPRKSLTLAVRPLYSIGVITNPSIFWALSSAVLTVEETFDHFRPILLRSSSDPAETADAGAAIEQTRHLMSANSYNGIWPRVGLVA